jgi:hypothetical protein
MSARSYLGTLPAADLERIGRLQERLKASTNVETLRRVTITMEQLLNHQDSGGDVVLCRKGRADRVVWFV